MGNRYSCKLTFEEWCIENNRYNCLELWDHELNDKSPSEIPYGTKEKYYFKCPNGIHDSYLRRIDGLTTRNRSALICKECGGHGFFMDLTGKIFGELTVLGIDKNTDNTSDIYWKCQCSCGKIVSVGGIKLRQGTKMACGKAGKHKSDLSPDEYERKNSEYRAFRKGVIEKANNICIISGLLLQDNEVHHIFPYSQYPELRYNINNGICIAKKYHSTSCVGSFHQIYGTLANNTPDNFEKYVNEKRRELGNYEYFDVMSYVYPCYEDNLPIDEDFNYIYQ